MFTSLFFLMLCTVLVECGLNQTECPNVKNKLGFLRKRRHIAFPDGSNFVLTISLVKAFMTHAPAGWNIALEIDVMFPLPDSKFTLAHHRRKLHHRQKRELWDGLRSALDLHNLNGRSCILRSVCEARAHLLPPGTSLLHDILRAIFTAPRYEEDFLEEMKKDYYELLDSEYCENLEDCPISLLNFITESNVT
ncbi:hypothetical protein O0L34_g15353 [Tuta absoluta]|nr:hypothetical protein O0L34_g15353 [Tuta absoluta]